MRINRVSKNLATALLLQVVTVICGFILPRFILKNFGSAYNGIINSVNQFLSCVTLLRAGVGGVTRAALYKTLAANDREKTAAIVRATEIFMRKIAVIFSVLLVVFAAVYPLFVAEAFDWFFSFSLVLVLGISVVVQYAFGITNQMLLHADQRLYVYNILQTLAVITNTALTVLLVTCGCGIHIAKLGSAVAFSITPVLMHLYVRKNYRLDRKIQPDHGAIGQRWDAFAHQLAAFIHTNTDIMVLTVFTDLLQVSVYAVYNLIVSGVNQMIQVCATAMESMLGSILARQDAKGLDRNVELYEFIINILCTVLYCCVAILIVPFVMIYTAKITDVDYFQPLLGYLMCISAFLSGIRLPYQNVIEAGGHFKQTKLDAILEAALNVTLSVLLVWQLGIVGVVIGTVVAMLYRTVRYAIYASRHILRRPLGVFLKRIAVSLAAAGLVMGIYFLTNIGQYLLRASNYLQWAGAAALVLLAVTVVVLTVNFVCYPRLTKQGAKHLLHKLRPKGSAAD